MYCIIDMKMNSFLLICVFVIICIRHEVKTSGIGIKVKQYFESDMVKGFRDVLMTNQNYYEDTLSLALQNHYKGKFMNIYTRRVPGANVLTHGFYVTYDSIQLLMASLHLRNLPDIILPEVKLGLADNVLHMKGALSTMFIETDYRLFRNTSDASYAHYPFLRAPLDFKNVQTHGQMTIRAEKCHLSGIAIATLCGQSVNLGHSTVTLFDCKFFVQIHKSGSLNAAPVIPFFSKQEGIELQQLLSKPIKDELATRLQGTMYGFVNTSKILGNKLVKIRYHQEKLFTLTSHFMQNLIGFLNQLTLEKNQGKMKLKDKSLYWNDLLYSDKTASDTRIIFSEIALDGLETAYSAFRGGPYKWPHIKLVDAIKFNSVHVQGKITFENATLKGKYDFSVEIRDLEVNVEMFIDEAQWEISTDLLRFKVYGWRSIEFPIFDINFSTEKLEYCRTLVISYLNNEIPKHIVQHMLEVLPEAISQTQHDTRESKMNFPTGNSSSNTGMKNYRSISSNNNLIISK